MGMGILVYAGFWLHDALYNKPRPRAQEAHNYQQ